MQFSPHTIPLVFAELVSSNCAGFLLLPWAGRNGGVHGDTFAYLCIS